MATSTKHTKFVVTRGALVAVAIACLAITAGVGDLVNIQRHLTRTQAQNRKAIVYICSTTTVLDALVVTAAKQIRESLDNGTYDRLVQQGLLRQKNVDAAKQTLTQYDRAHLKLNKNIPCRSVAPHAKTSHPLRTHRR